MHALLMKLYPSSLMLVSAYGLLDNLTRLLLGAYIGQYIDRSAATASTATGQRSTQHNDCRHYCMLLGTVRLCGSCARFPAEILLFSRLFMRQHSSSCR